MKMTELDFEGAQPPIDSYAPSGFRVAGAFHEGSLLLGPTGLSSWPAATLREIEQDAAMAPLLALSEAIDVLLIGAGAEIAPLPKAQREALEAAGIGVEIMATPPACRTYNVLLSEGRRVAAALIAI